jgi:hypothetical protein
MLLAICTAHSAKASSTFAAQTSYRYGKKLAVNGSSGVVMYVRQLKYYVVRFIHADRRSHACILTARTLGSEVRILGDNECASAFYFVLLPLPPPPKESYQMSKRFWKAGRKRPSCKSITNVFQQKRLQNCKHSSGFVGEMGCQHRMSLHLILSFNTVHFFIICLSHVHFNSLILPPTCDIFRWSVVISFSNKIYFFISPMCATCTAHRKQSCL